MGSKTKVRPAGKTKVRPAGTTKTKKVDRYVSRIPRAVPAGMVLVHNHVRPDGPDHLPNVNGFRAWLATPEPQYVPCSCGWAADMPGGHYRVSRAKVAAKQQTSRDGGQGTEPTKSELAKMRAGEQDVLKALGVPRRQIARHLARTRISNSQRVSPRHRKTTKKRKTA